MRPQPRYQPGDKIGGRYQVHQALMGGMGEVYLCLDLETTQPCALKTFQQRFLTNLRLRAAFENEVAIWVALGKHPNIVRCFYMDTLDNRPFMILEWIASDENRGTDLRGWLRHGPLDLRLALDFTIHICRGLVHANEKQPGIVHRDLKPENILVAKERLARITDFGLAKVVQEAGLETIDEGGKTEERQSLWGQGGIVGTPPYMAPEQWRGEAVDARTDIYAIGCILYEMLVGSRPFQARELDDLRRQHLESDIPRLVGDRATPDLLNTLLSHCLSKRRRERFADVNDLLEQLVLLYKQVFAELPKTAIIAGGNEFSAADYRNRGVTYHSLQRYDEAMADCNRAIQLDSSFAYAYNTRGSVYCSLRRYKEALADFSRAIQLDPKAASAYGNRGIVYRELGRYDDALADCSQALQLDPNLAQVYSNRGFVYESLQRFDEALADYNRAIQLNQDLPEAYVNRSAIFFATGRLAEGLSDIDQALHLNPALPRAYMNRANAYMMLNRSKEALVDFSRAIKLDPNDAQIYYNRAKLYETLQQFDKALSDYDCAIQIDPNYSWAYDNRGHIHSILGHLDESLDDFTRAIEADPSHVLAYTNRGTLYIQLNQYAEAISDFTSAIHIEPTNVVAYTNRGAAYHQMGQFDNALADFRKGIELDPNNALAYRNIGMLAYERGMLQEALQYFEQAAERGDADGAEYATRVRKEMGIMPASQDNLAQIVHRLKTDEKFRKRFRSDPVRCVAEYQLTIGQVLELVASRDIPLDPMQSLKVTQELLEFIASYGDR